MPCLSNLLNSPASALTDLKPLHRGTRLEPELNQAHAQELDPEVSKLGRQLTESVDGAKRDEFRASGEGGGAIGSFVEPELRFNKAVGEGGEGTERAVKICIKIKGPSKVVEELSKRKIEQGIPEFECSLPFLAGAPKLIQCGVFQRAVESKEKISCSFRSCQSVFHLACVKETPNFPSSRKKQFKCPQHTCFLCKQKNNLWRCKKCPIACHDKCAPFPENVVHLPDRPGEAICWRHPTDWHLEKDEVPVSTMEDIFSLLPPPYNEEEFKIDINWKDKTETKLELPPYVQIQRNVSLIKRRRDSIDTDIWCTCSSTQCSDGCVQKTKKVQIVQTEQCGWGVVAGESIGKGDFIIEYVGEIIDDVLCERRLRDMKDKDAKNFYMCEISKDFVIDATFKGNAARFLNHSCAPNCVLEKWQVEGETRVGIFASRHIEVGEQLTYDYRFVQFVQEVECCCGAPNCRGYLGTKRKIGPAPKTEWKRNMGLKVSWGPKKRRTSYRMV